MTTLKESLEAGRISTGNTKMPGSTFAISAKHCNVGGKLAQIKGSVCHKCYALKLQSFRPTVNAGWTGNLDKANRMIKADPARWVAYITFQINKAFEKTGEPYHRWFDSGDLQSVEMLDAICAVARATPHIRHWLPTRETKVVKDFTGVIPDNLMIRISSPMVDDKPIKAWPWTSTVHKTTDPVGHVCPARNQGNACGSCRACWSDDVPNISYPLH